MGARETGLYFKRDGGNGRRATSCRRRSSRRGNESGDVHISQLQGTLRQIGRSLPANAHLKKRVLRGFPFFKFQRKHLGPTAHFTWSGRSAMARVDQEFQPQIPECTRCLRFFVFYPSSLVLRRLA